MLQKNWVMLNRYDSSVIEEFSCLHSVTPLIAILLLNREIVTQDQVHAFFHPTVEQLHSPMLFRNMEAAVHRLLKARVRGEKIAVYGDSDVDGLSALTILTRFLRKYDWNVVPYLPQRNHTEYGFHCEAVDDLINQGVDLIVTVDVGTTAHKAIEYANSKGITVIVTDHHELSGELPPAFAIINPKVQGETYPFHDLAGCGVAFKLVHAISKYMQLDFSEIAPLLEYVALGTTADIVSVCGENRTLLTLGFEQLSQTQFPGLKALAESAEMELAGVGIDELLLAIAPRINAASRMGVPQHALQLLLTDDSTVADQCAIAMEQEKYRRKRMDDEMMKLVQQQIKHSFDPQKDPAIVVAGEGWHLGIIGIVASRIAEMYHRPTAVLAIENGIAKGSVRSVDGVDIFAALEICKEDLLQFGGHRNAAGMSVEKEKVPLFTQHFKDAIQQLVSIEDLRPTCNIDAEITLDQIHFAFFEQLQRLAPFGPSNPKPIFLAKNLEIMGEPRVTSNRHLFFKVRQKDTVYSAIGFGMGQRLSELKRMYIDLCFHVQQSLTHWGPILQLRIVDFRTSNRN
ncbi:MAG: single-stranded-DNA-specific exonuclease RecJ [bacterium]|nr:single-stranded-DNA-specific exonuclease RecJ [bacterium]